MSQTPFTGVTFTIELALGYNALAGTYAWTDVTAYGRVASIKTGRGTELSDFQASSCSVVFDNRDRRFEPLYTGGAYYPNIKVRCPIRISSTVGGTTVYHFFGFVNDWPQAWNGIYDGYVTVTATDGMDILSRAIMHNSAFIQEVTNDTPKAWWAMADVNGSLTTIGRMGNGWDLAYNFYPTFGVASLLGAYDTNTCGTFSTVIGTGGRTTNGSSVISTTPFTIEAWVALTTVGTKASWIFSQVNTPDTAGAGNGGIDFFVGGSSLGTTGVPTCSITDNVGAFCSVTGSKRVDDGLPHHIVVTCSSLSSMTMYVDGVSTSSSGTAANMPVWPTLVGGIPKDAGLANQGFPGQLQHVAIYSTALSAGRVAAHYSAGTGWVGETTGTRIGHYLDYAGWPAGMRSIATGDATLAGAPAPTTGSATSYLTLIKSAEQSEQGRFYFDGAGNAVFRNKKYLYSTATSNTSQLTLDDSGSNPFLPNVNLEFSNTQIINHAQFQKQTGGWVEVSDSTSMTAYGEHTDPMTAPASMTDTQALYLAQARVYMYKQPQVRIKSIPIRIASTGGIMSNGDAVRKLKIDNRITVTFTPMKVGGSSFSDQLIIEGIDDSFTPSEWQRTIYATPIGTETFWVLGTSQLGSSTIIGP